MYTYIEKIAEILQQIQMEAVDSKVPVFSILNISSRHGKSGSEMEDIGEDMHLSNHTNTTHTVIKKSAVIIKGLCDILCCHDQ